jgi:hypothetical protein
MAQEVQRVRYFNGEFLQEGDFNGEQAYHIRMRYLHNRWLHTLGIANGLEVTAGPGPLQVTVSPGLAVARVIEARIPEFLGEDVGKEIVLTSSLVVDVPGAPAGQSYVVASFAEQPAQPVTAGDTRWLERPDVRALPNGSPVPDNQTRLILARVTLNAAGTSVTAVDLSERRGAGIRGEVESTQIRLPVSGVSDANQWPRLRGGAANRLDLTGSLNLTAGGVNLVAGDVTLAANRTVDGRDVSADGAALDAHVASTALHVTNGNNHDHSGGDGAPIPWAAITAVPDIMVKAYAVATGTTVPPTVLRGFALNSVVRNSMGNYTINWAVSVPNPVILISLLFPGLTQTFFYHITTINPASLTFVVTDSTGTAVDAPRLMVSVL